MEVNRRCSAERCENDAVTQFEHNDFCVNHFVSRCYADLERLDPRAGGGRAVTGDRMAVRAFAEECAQKALEISLRGCAMDNLQRGRLLDILLWAGEIWPVNARTADQRG